VFGLHRFKLHRLLVYGAVKSVWFRQVSGLLRVRFRQVFRFTEGSLLVVIKKRKLINIQTRVCYVMIMFNQSCLKS
jgi:hypothetical protein